MSFCAILVVIITSGHQKYSTSKTNFQFFSLTIILSFDIENTTPKGITPGEGYNNSDGFLDQAQGSEKRKYDRNLLISQTHSNTGEKVKQSLQAQPEMNPYTAILEWTVQSTRVNAESALTGQ
ncbi:hypothetical protein EV424DRAFT_1345485 [Suillus variegatus]|nr:hypothetical protein EV424DRAFT_1345485 [Suillus variegatus]